MASTERNSEPWRQQKEIHLRLGWSFWETGSELSSWGDVAWTDEVKESKQDSREFDEIGCR
jgi:hypothetical protein